MLDEIKIKKYSFLLDALFASFIFIIFAFANPASAESSGYLRCEPGSDCILGEYVFQNDGTAVSTQACVITVKNPSGVTLLNEATMDYESDGWHHYTFSSSSPEGLYRSLMCCTVGADSSCIDKSFIIGTSFESLAEVESDTKLIRGATFDFVGYADAGSTTSTLVDAELTQPDDYWADYTLIMLSGNNAGQERAVTGFTSSSDTLSFAVFSSTINPNDKYVLKRNSSLIVGIWSSANRTLTSATTIAGDLWNHSTRTLTSLGSIAADVWNGAFAPSRNLTSQNLSGGGSLSTETHAESLKDQLEAEIGTVEVNLSSTESKIDTVLANTVDIEAKIDALDSSSVDLTELLDKWDEYEAEDLISRLEDIDKQVEKATTGELARDLNDLKKLVNDDLEASKIIQNRAIELKNLITINRSLLENKPVVKTFYEWGSVVLKMVAANPLDTKQTIDFRAALPKEVKAGDVINKSEGLSMEFDAEKDRYFVSASIELEGNRSETKFVEVRDIWTIDEKELESLLGQSQELSKPLEKSALYAQSVTIQNDINARLEKIKMRQAQEDLTPEEHILGYRENVIELESARKDIESLKNLVGQVSEKNLFQGSLMGVSVTTTWAIILMIVVGIGVLMILLFIILRRLNRPRYPERSYEEEPFSDEDSSEVGYEAQKSRKSISGKRII